MKNCIKTPKTLVAALLASGSVHVADAQMCGFIVEIYERGIDITPTDKFDDGAMEFTLTSKLPLVV